MPQGLNKGMGSYSSKFDGTVTFPGSIPAICIANGGSLYGRYGPASSGYDLEESKTSVSTPKLSQPKLHK